MYFVKKKNMLDLFIHIPKNRSFNFVCYVTNRPVPIAERSKANTVFDRLKIGIAGSNYARGMDVCPRFFLFCVVLCRQSPCIGLISRPRSPTKCPNRFMSSEVKILNRNRPLA
jgi:hypothetical protein